MAILQKKKADAKAVPLGKRKAVSTKQCMNLAFHEKTVNPKTLIPLVLVLVIFTALFVKFGVLDLIQQKVDAVNEVSSKQTNLAAINASLSGYDEVAYQYGRYSYGWLNATESSLLSRVEILDILESIIAKKGVIENFAVNNNILNVNISGLSLNQTSSLVKQLEADPRVSDVFVYTAVSEDAELNAHVGMTIILVKEAEEQ